MAPSSSNKNASASASTPATARNKWTYRQYMLCRLVIVEYINERNLIEHEQRDVVAAVFAELNPGIKKYEWWRLVEHETTHKNEAKSKDMHRAWRVRVWDGEPYTGEEEQLLNELRKEINASTAWKRYQAQRKKRTGSLGEECGRLEGSDAEWDAEHGQDEEAVEDDE